ncbi:DUF2207 domain-containing protein, partial [Patescibacteria group bacterium]
MRKLFFLFFLIAISAWAGPAIAQEQIESFVVNININKDTSIEVTEEIDYSFGDLEKHGIYRDIPYKYKTDDGDQIIKLTVISVIDNSGTPYQFKISKQGNNQRIKIGDPDKTITGARKYIIKYRVKKVINYFDERAELYWNVTGNDWEVPIKQSKAEVQLPTQVAEELVKGKCYTGPFGSSDPCVSTRYKYSSENIVGGFVFVDDKLSEGNGVTVVVGFPRDILVEPSAIDELIDSIKNSWIALLPLLTLAVLIYLWRTKGRDPKGRGTIIAQFDPPDNLTPAEVGTIVDEKTHKKDISAEIIHLAIKGYLRITRIENDGLLFKKTDYLLEQLKDDSGLSNGYEKDLLNALFKEDNLSTTIKEIKKTLTKSNKISKDSPILNTLINIFEPDSIKDGSDQKEPKKKVVKLSSLENKFYKDLEQIEKKIYNSVVGKQYFLKS